MNGTPTGSPGSPSGSVVTVQGIAGGNSIPMSTGLPAATDASVSRDSSALASHASKATPGRFMGAFAANGSAVQLYFMVFDNQTVPANGTAPAYSQSAPAKANIALPCPGLNGDYFSARGISWAWSTTPDTLTVYGGGSTFATVLYL